MVNTDYPKPDRQGNSGTPDRVRTSGPPSSPTFRELRIRTSTVWQWRRYHTTGFIQCFSRVQLLLLFICGREVPFSTDEYNVFPHLCPSKPKTDNELENIYKHDFSCLFLFSLSIQVGDWWQLKNKIYDILTK